jgi:heat shock protein HslJ
VVGELSSTEMGCEPAVMELVQRFLAALQAVDSYELAGSLVLGRTGDGTSLTFDRLPPVPDAALVGTTWVLDTFIDGDVASSSPLMGSARLELRPDGTLDGSSGCRPLSGRWEADGPRIRLTALTAIEDPTAGICAPESEEIEHRLLAVLGDGFTPVVEGSRLTIVSEAGAGLSFVASQPAT